MYTPLKSPRLRTRLSALHACLAATFSLAAAHATATTWTVNTCADGETGDLTTHTGTLRFAVDNAGESDTIDMSGLTCGTISLVSGEIAIDQNSLTLNGPTTGKLTIERQVHSPLPFRIFDHQGTGTLQINYLTIAHGNEANNSGNASGGCIYSNGGVNLKQSVVTACEVQAPGHIAVGGGVFAKGNLSLKYSTLSHDYANGAAAQGGGACVGGTFTSTGSTIQDNNAYSANGDTSRGYTSHGGGILALGSVIVQSSTISGNSATTDGMSRGFVGGIFIVGQASTDSATFISSTISHNSAQGYIGGVYSNVSLALEGTTVAYNYASFGELQGSDPLYLAPGVAVFAKNNATITLESSIIAGNLNGPFESDFSTEVSQSGVTIVLAGANNLIRVAAGVANVPFDTISSCPLLGPLRNNGGPTATHALLSHSPAIDAGNNVVSQDFDQRGSPYARVSGSAADIGAYEVQQGDIIFNSSFEDCL